MTEKENDSKNKSKQSKSHVDWSFANFPLQISTVGYSTTDTKGEVNRAVSKEDIHVQDSPKNKNNSLKVNTKDQFLERSQESLEQIVDADFVVPIAKDELKSDKKSPTDQDSSIPEKEMTKIDKDKSQNVSMNSTNNSTSVSKPTVADNSTSLDLLVGLLNEIKNITTCQTQLTGNGPIENDVTETQELEYILKRVEFHESSPEPSPQNILSLSSLQNITEQSFCAIYNNMGCNVPNNSIMIKNNPLHLDKEINVNIGGIEYVSTISDVPSQFLPLNVHHSTNVTSSLVNVIREPSEQSMYYFSDYHTLYSNSSFNKIIEIPKVETQQSRLGVITFGQESVRKNKRTFNAKGAKRLSTPTDVPNLKIKRDILVTVYSILVMTVFAALSFPEIFYRT
ncbi:unnamed protein product [Leptosia nina]